MEVLAKKKQRSIFNVNNPFTLNSQTPTFLHGESLCCHFVDHNSREVTLTPPPRIHLIVCFLVLTETCLFVVQTATSAFDGVDEMCLHRVCCLLSVLSRDNDSLNGGWVQAGTHPFLIYSHSRMLCGCLLSLKYRCDLRTKAAVCSLISSPKLIFLIAVCCVHLSWTWVGFYKKRLKLCLNIKEPEKVPQKALTFWHHHTGWFAVNGGKWTWNWLCPPLISCKESLRKNKRWARRNNVVLSRAQLIV